MTPRKFDFPKGRERPVQIHPRYLPDAAWTTMRTVRFSDCDPAGIVYTPRFIDLMARSRIFLSKGCASIITP